ncbi:hypothetical protein TNCV_3908651 [Trichonephila clavipes]|nr:hypothetical protein TNCV_3908651 [Trichonephila clavipes]
MTGSLDFIPLEFVGKVALATFYMFTGYGYCKCQDSSQNSQQRCYCKHLDNSQNSQQKYPKLEGVPKSCNNSLSKRTVIRTRDRPRILSVPSSAK